VEAVAEPVIIPTRETFELVKRLYEVRNRIACRIYRLQLADLERLDAGLARATDDDLRTVARFLEALVQTPDNGPSFGDGW
jgi:hypothetical protein